MKDAFGGVFMLRILIIFFVVFVCFMTVAVSYVRVYRIKNNVISILEREDNPGDVLPKIDRYVNASGYVNDARVNDDCTKRAVENSGTYKDGTIRGNAYGICIIPYGEVIDGIYKYHYQVTAYIVLDFPLFHLGTVVPISGETRPLYMGASS